MTRPTQPRLLALLGDPVAHSLSPAMQNAAFQATGLPYVYIAARVERERFGEAVAALRLLEARGANVTAPHKERAAALADRLAPEAERAGSVNTLVFEGGRILGYNTDGAAFCRAVAEVARVDVKGRRVLLLGAGGAARSVAMALAERGVERIHIVNRTPARALDLAARVEALTGVPAAAEEWPDEQGRWQPLLAAHDLVIQATSAGAACPWDALPWDVLPEGALLADLAYAPGGTPFVRAAHRAGRKGLPGEWMLLYQGAEAFRLWTGVEAPLEAMRAALAGAGLFSGAGPSAPSPEPPLF
ncbi:MAG TPA: shikimate dehydrogenase [Limnochorda sp.]